MATRRQGLKRIKQRRLSERSEFSTLPVSVPGGACSPCEARTAIVGPPFLPHFFGGAKKRVGRRAEHPATLHGSERCNASPARQAQHWRLALADRCNGNGNCRCAGKGAEVRIVTLLPPAHRSTASPHAGRRPSSRPAPRRSRRGG